LGLAFSALATYAGRVGIYGLGAYRLSVGRVAWPAAASRPAACSSAQRFRLRSDHLLAGFRGVNFKALRSSPIRLTRLSIRPKQSASRTESS